MGKFFNWFHNLMSDQQSVEPMANEAGNEEQEIALFAAEEVGNLENQFAPINLELMFSPIIPVGFQFGENEIMKIYFSMDYSTLRLSQETLHVPQEVVFSDDEEEHTLQCNVPVEKYSAVGTIFYNMVFSGAEPIDFLGASVKRGETVYQSTTGISYYDKLLINQKLGYACPDQKVEENFVFNVTIKTPYVVDENGNKIPLEPVIEGASLPLEEAKSYGTYYGNKYLVASSGSTPLYVPCEITVESVQPIS